MSKLIRLTCNCVPDPRFDMLDIVWQLRLAEAPGTSQMVIRARLVIFVKCASCGCLDTITITNLNAEQFSRVEQWPNWHWRGE